MRKHILAISILASSQIATAENFDPMHARATAMGGTGVASSKTSAAPLFNPALLATQHQSADFAMAFPIVGVRAADEDDLIDTVDEFDESGVVDNLDTAITGFNNAVQSGNPTNISNSITQLNSNIGDLNSQLSNLSGKALRANAGAGFVLAIPSRKFSAAFSFNTTGAISAQFNYQDANKVNNLRAALDDLSDDINNGNVDLGDLNDLLGKSYAQYLAKDLDNDGTLDTLNPNGEIDLGDFNSQVRMIGVAITDLGISFARHFEYDGHTFAIGITPKLQRVDTFDYTAIAIQQDENGDYTSGLEDFEDQAEDADASDDGFNLDLGVAYTTGKMTYALAVKNAISQEYESLNNSVVVVDPRATLGVSYQNGGFNVALDADLTEQVGLLVGEETQFVGFGMEYNLGDTAQMRIGYRHNIADADDDLVSLGFGLSPFGVSLDLTVVASTEEDEVGAVVQTGFRF